METTREFLQLMPYQPLQGSEPTQLGIWSCQESLRDFRTSTAWQFYVKNSNYISKLL